MFHLGWFTKLYAAEVLAYPLPVQLAPLLANATEHLGIFATMSPSFYPPFMLARTLATLSHLTNGRVGWNIVTSSEHRSAQNFGMEKLWQHDSRYDRADEFVEIAELLWDSWGDNAVVMDRETWAYADYSKVRPEYRNDIRARVERFGRDPDSVKLMFLLSPVLGDTETEARAAAERLAATSDWNAESTLAHLSAVTENDFSIYDLDGPVPELDTNGHKSTLADFFRNGQGKTLKEAASKWEIDSFPALGTPDQVAERMGEVMEEVGGDGYLISNHGETLHRRYIGEITEGLVPALQRMGLTRTSYQYDTFRENLFAF